MDGDERGRRFFGRPHVRVRGEASVPARPDEVRLMLLLREVRDAADEALRGVAKRQRTLEAVLDELEIPTEARTTAAVSVREEREHERNRWVHKGFAAEARTVLRLTDPEPLGRLMTKATSRADARIEGPWWRVRPDNPARLEACRQAVLDARVKAEAYAEALGATLGPILWIREPGEEASVVRPFAARMPMAMQAGGGGPDLPVEPGEMDVGALVDVAFELVQPAS